MRKTGHPLEYIVTATTRPRRQAEQDHIDYHFISQETFSAMIQNEEFLEWANVYGNRYGVPRVAVKQALKQGRDVILKVDIQGAATIKQKTPQAVFIFLAPPSIEELIVRLNQRHTESPSTLVLRSRMATEEMTKLTLFDYVVVNEQDKLDQAVSQIWAIITAEKCRAKLREITL